MVITLFTRPLCALCSVMAHWLRQLNVAFAEVDVTAAPDARRLLRTLARGELSVPTLLFEDGRVLIELARQALLEALRHRPR